MPKRYIILFYLILFFSCDSKKNAVGDFNEIVIVTSNEDKDLIYPYLYPILSKSIKTPLNEPVFKINWIDSEDFFKYQYYKNILIISLAIPKDNTSDKLFSKFQFSEHMTSDAFANENIFAKYNTIANNQIIMCIGADDSIELSDIINNHKDWIFDTLDDNISESLYAEYMKNETAFNIVELIKDNFNWHLPIDENFKIIKNENDFLWLGRGYPYRWLTIHQKIKKPQNFDSPDQIVDVYKQSIEQTMQNVTIVDKFVTYEVDGRILILRGLYEHDESDTGGPFFTYIIKNNKNNELTFISGFVNNPGKTKYYLLKQLESLISANLNDESLKYFLRKE